MGKERFIDFGRQSLIVGDVVDKDGVSLIPSGGPTPSTDVDVTAVTGFAGGTLQQFADWVATEIDALKGA